MAEPIPRYVITLVHGTFAASASWVKEDSKLCQSIKHALDASIRFERFIWSGHNSHAARLTAGEALGRQLVQHREAYPQSRHFVIAHSHGGMVTLYALKNPNLQNAISGIIFLGTPFIKTSAFDLYPLFSLFSLGLGCLAFVASMLTAIVVMGMLGLSTSIGAFLGLLLMAASFYLIDAVRTSSLKQLVAIQGRALQRLAIPQISTPILVASSGRDEAKAWLSSLSNIARIGGSAPEALIVIWAYSLFFFFFSFVIGLFTNINLLVTLGTIAFVFFVVGIPLLFVPSILVYLLLQSVLGVSIAYGWGPFSGYFLCQTSVDRYIGSRNSLSQRVEYLAKGQKKGLHHSALYSDEAIISMIGEWCVHVDRLSPAPTRRGP